MNEFEHGQLRAAIQAAPISELGVQVNKLLKSWKYELETRLTTIQGFADTMQKEVAESQAWQSDHIARERAQTMDLIEEHDRSNALLSDHFSQQSDRLERELQAVRLQLEQTVTELRPAMGGTSAIVSGLDHRLAEARVHAQRAAEDIDQAAAMSVRAVGELQATASKLLTRLAIHEERQRAAEAELKAALRQFVVDETATQLDALRNEALELIRHVGTELRYEANTARRAHGARIDGMERALGQLADEIRSAAARNGALESSVRDLSRELQLAEARLASSHGRRASSPPRARAEAEGALEESVRELQHDLYVHARALEQLKRHRVGCPQCGAMHVVGELIRLQTVGAPPGSY